MLVGGELTLDSFEIRTDSTAGVSEAPIQLKSNGGVLVIDDFGRQRVTPKDILNRWIVPLAQRFDILTLRNGRKFAFPIDQLVVFSTNLEPKALVDEAFLRRIPYKIDVQNPSEDEFRSLVKKIAGEWGIKHQEDPVDYLIEKYYKTSGTKCGIVNPATSYTKFARTAMFLRCRLKSPRKLSMRQRRIISRCCNKRHSC